MENKIGIIVGDFTSAIETHELIKLLKMTISHLECCIINCEINDIDSKVFEESLKKYNNTLKYYYG